MTTSVGVHVHLPEGSGPGVPPAIVQLVQSAGQPPPHSVGEMTIPHCSQAIRVLQFQVMGLSRVDTGKHLVAEIERLGFEARLLVHHRSSSAATSVWWPDPPSWPTWEWPIDLIRDWLQRGGNSRMAAPDPNDGMRQHPSIG
jgi:hypothetical protein